MGVTYGQLNLSNCKTAKDIISQYPYLYGRDGYYYVFPKGPTGPKIQVWCDMTTDGGGYMLIARSHPTTVNYNGQKWGWQGGQIGTFSDFTQAYQAGWWTYWHGNATFTDFIYGNRNNINDNTWGPFIYKRGISYTTFMTSDTQQSSLTATVLKYNTNIYGDSAGFGMQSAIGFPLSGTASNVYWMRDCCGFSGNAYGGTPTSFNTTYCSYSPMFYAGPWCGGSTTDGSGNFVQGGSNLTTNTGGTNQYMIMVR